MVLFIEVNKYGVYISTEHAATILDLWILDNGCLRYYVQYNYCQQDILCHNMTIVNWFINPLIAISNGLIYLQGAN